MREKAGTQSTGHFGGELHPGQPLRSHGCHQDQTFASRLLCLADGHRGTGTRSHEIELCVPQQHERALEATG